MVMPKILVIHSPNQNLLGNRETSVYGTDTLAACQSNAEATLVDRVHAAKSGETVYIAINPAAYTHTSVALRATSAQAAS